MGTVTEPIDREALQAELEALRQRNADLEMRRSVGQRSVAFVRVTAVILLMTIGALLATVSVPAIWARNLVLNTDRYVETMAPLAANPGIQAGVIKAIDKQFDDNVDIGALARQVLPDRAAPLAGPLESAAESLVNTVATKFVQSQAFVALWTDINRVAHTQIVAVLTGTGDDKNAVAIKNGVVTLNLQPVVEQVKTQLVQAGLTVASKVPTVGATVEIAHVEGVEKARGFTRLLNRAAVWLPLLGIVCLVVAVVLSRRRRRSVVTAALAVGAGMVIVAVALVLGRSAYLNALPGVYFSHDAAKDLFDTLVRFLRSGLRIVLIAALLACLIAWFTGPTSSARASRRVLAAGPKKLHHWWTDSRAATVVAANRGVAAGAIFGLAALILVIWSNPTVLVLAVIGVITLALLLLVYLVKTTDASRQPPPAHATGHSG